MVARRERQPVRFHVLLEVRREARRYVGAVGPEVGTAVRESAHSQIVLLEQVKQTEPNSEAARKTLLLVTRKPVRAGNVVVRHFEKRKHDR